MSIQAGKEYLKQFGLEDKVLEFEVSSATVELAAQAVGVEGKRIAKTLSFKIDKDAILILAAGDAKVDNKKYKATFSAKAKMLSPDEVVELIGHAIGGVCPFGIKENVKTYLDESLKRFETVFPAVGSSNSAIEMTIPDLEKYAQNYVGWVDVCKGWQDE
ncbi:MAG: YbaK/EbsC family protein [Clostridia bacterium]|nr:YbaK/EbsC family protein [Clostridia bacterium]